MKTLKRITALQALPIAALAIALMSRSECSAADESGISFFEQKIRPMLVEHCYACHSVEALENKKLQGALYLDSAAGVAAGGESGAVVVTGKSADSLLMKALRYDGLEMPPSGKLSDEVIADFAKWIDLGAPDPREGSVPVKPKREINLDEGRRWWAFQPLQAVKLPIAANPIDGFISIAQQSQGLKPGVPAGKEALLRRAYFDLIGLPPTPEQMAAYVADASPRAFEKVVDELLASPAYGERWARHWLDAARFAESGGYEFDRFRPGAYHYRDWVISALNSDMAYDQFVQMQLAGDVISPDSIEGAAATGFLVAGPYPGQITVKTVERIRYDQLDDMMMTIGGSMLGLTLGCARCHEHKYDPIPHQDYYALAAAMATTAHGPRPLDPDPAATALAQEKHNADQQPLLDALNAFAATELPTRFTTWQEKELSKQPAATRWQTMEPVDLEAERSYLKESAGGLIVHDGMLAAGSVVRQRGQSRKVRADEVYRLTFHTHQKNLQSLRLDAFTDGSLPARGPGLNSDGSFQLGEITVTARPINLQSKDVPKNLKLKPLFAAFEDKDQPLSNAADGRPETAWIVKTTAKKDNAAIFEFEEPLAGFDGGTELVVELTFRELGMGRLRFAFSVDPNPATWAGEVTTQHASELRAIMATHGKELPDSMRVPLARWFAPFDPETAKVFYAVRDHRAAVPRPHLQEVYTTVSGGQDVFFLRRGEVDNKAGKAEPGFLQVMWRKNEDPAVADSPAAHPRVALAKWMTDVNNGAGALLARVIVNRLWQHHLGQGIVGTPNDFGVQGDRPTHPELLEHLAQELLRQGWKLKPLHRAIMLSDVYQQSHVINPDNLKIDSANRYWWHFPPRRLEAETIRDALLAAGGNGDSLMYGASVLEDSQRRSVYLRVKRSELLPIMAIFDAPEPTQSIGKRSVTTVPTQALAMMNSPLVRQQAEKLTARIRPTADQPLSTSIVLAYQIAFGRSPSEAEQLQMTAFIEKQREAIGRDSPESTEKALTEFCHVLLCLNEFVYID
ncbi:MAG: PSD1 and planctomycete cytochrome C domain-containing protein [Planctomycetota bacterium]|nr:PSD1 and planctomycete cytochrome C domain-containing protein [Planctomycetota bacterium]